MLKKTIYLMIALVMILGVFGLSGCTYREKEARELIKHYTEIEIPKDSKMVYRISCGSFDQGRNDQYRVFEFTEEPVDFLESNDFSEDEDGKIKELFLEHLKTSYYMYWTGKRKQISSEFLPDWENDYLCLETRLVFFFYFPSQLRLIVFVSDGFPAV